MSCYCGNTQPYSQCCEPIHLNPHSAQVPEQLMRARFSAHILKNVEFVIETYHPLAKPVMSVMRLANRYIAIGFALRSFRPKWAQPLTRFCSL